MGVNGMKLPIWACFELVRCTPACGPYGRELPLMATFQTSAGDVEKGDI